jgi:hypothetical protein
VAFTRNDVEDWLGQPHDSLDATVLDRLIAGVTDHAGDHYTQADVSEDRWDQALIMQTGRLWQRKYSPDGLAGTGSDDLAPIRIPSFDVDVQRLLSRGLKVAGLFGPTATSDEA